MKIGDKVVCVESEETWGETYQTHRGKIYTLSSDVFEFMGEKAVRLEETNRAIWVASCYRKIDEDQHTYTNALTKKLSQVKELKEYNPLELPQHLEV